MGDFNEILKAAIDGGDHLESAMRKAASLAAKEAIESLLRTETKTILGYDRHDPPREELRRLEKRHVPKDDPDVARPDIRGGAQGQERRMQAIAIPRHRRRTDLITSTVLKLCCYYSLQYK